MYGRLQIHCPGRSTHRSGFEARAGNKTRAPHRGNSKSRHETKSLLQLAYHATNAEKHHLDRSNDNP